MYNSSLAWILNTTTAWSLTTLAHDGGVADFVTVESSTSVDVTSPAAPTEGISGQPCEGVRAPSPTMGSDTSSVGGPVDDTSLKLPGSLDALLYIVIVLLFYACSIVILLVKYVRREREEAGLRNYYHEFVARDKFRSPQYRNRQFMQRIFGIGGRVGSRRNGPRDGNRHGSGGAGGVSEVDCGEDQALQSVHVDDMKRDVINSTYQNGRPAAKGRSQTITRNGNTFCRLLTEEEDNTRDFRESFKFLGANSKFRKKGLFGRKQVCNRPMCPKCVSESEAPAIDWGDGKCSADGLEDSQDVIEIRLYQPLQRSSTVSDRLRGGGSNKANYNCSDHLYTARRDYCSSNKVVSPVYGSDDGDRCFQPIIECDSELDEIHVETNKPRCAGITHWATNSRFGVSETNSSGNMKHGKAVVSLHDVELDERGGSNFVRKGRTATREGARDTKPITVFEEGAHVSSCSLEVSGLLGQIPVVRSNVGSRHSHDMDTLDGLSNLESEAEAHSLFNCSASLPGAHSYRGEERRISPGGSDRGKLPSSSGMREAAGSEGRHRDLSDFLSERTSLLSCSLSIAKDNDDDDGDDEGVLNEEDNEGDDESCGSAGLPYPASFGHFYHQPRQQNGHHYSHLDSNQPRLQDDRNGFVSSTINGKVKSHHDLGTNGKTFLNSSSKQTSNANKDGDVMRILSDISMLTTAEESGIFKNLKYFLRSFSSHSSDGGVDEGHEKSNLLPKETYFGPGSPKSIYASSPGESCAVVVPTSCESVGGRTRNLPYTAHETAFNDNTTTTASAGRFPRDDQDLLSLDLDDEDLNSSYNGGVNDDDEEDDEFPCYGEDRWGYAYDEDDEVMTSDGERSSSFGEYCMGEPSESQIIDLSQPLIRRQLDAKVKDGLSRAFIGLGEPWREDEDEHKVGGILDPRALNKPNPMIAGYGAARRETKV